MKPILPLLVILLLTFSCKPEQGQKDSNQTTNTTKLEIDIEEEIESVKNVVYKTATGKSIELIITKKSSGLSDFTIVALDFANSKDSLGIKDSEPLQQVMVEDLDGNGYDELYLITTSSGSGSYGSVFGFASNQDLSLTTIYVPGITENDVQLDGPFFGYMGHDSIYSNEGEIFRKYPIYKEGDPNCCPTGGDKTLGYQLRAGEASWILEIKDSIIQ
jgi:hypothetical protein